VGTAGELDDDGDVDQAGDRLAEGDGPGSRDDRDRVVAWRVRQGVEGRPEAVVAQPLKLPCGA